MKIVIIALLVALARAATILPLSGLGAAPANPAYTLTATYPIGSPNVVVTAFSGISTYAMATPSPAIGTVSLTFTYVNTNQTVFPSVTYGTGINANAVTLVLQSSTTAAGLTTAVYSNPGSVQSFRFDTLGTYGVVVSAQSTVGYTYASLPLPGTATGTSLVVTGNAYGEPVLATFNMITANGCTTTGCTAAPNATATVTPVLATWYLTAFFRATGAPQAGVFSTGVQCDATSLCNFGDGFASSWSGSIGTFSVLGYGPSFSLTAGSTLVPQGGSAAGSASIYDQRVGVGYSTFINEQVFAGKQAPITFPIGSIDVAPPTCTSAIFAPASGTTIDVSVNTELAIICADVAGGSGLYRKGAFASATGSGASGGITATFAYNQLGSAVSGTVSFPPYVTGTIQIIGVYAVDNALNSALYGSCGTYPGLTTIGCGGGGSGSSSASSVSLSLFAFFSLVVMAFFA